MKPAVRVWPALMVTVPAVFGKTASFPLPSTHVVTAPLFQKELVVSQAPMPPAPAAAPLTSQENVVAWVGPAAKPKHVAAMATKALFISFTCRGWESGPDAAIE